MDSSGHHFTSSASALTLINGLVVVAGLVRDAMMVSVLPHPGVVASVTTSSLGAVDHMLHGQISRRPHCFPLDVDTI